VDHDTAIRRDIFIARVRRVLVWAAILSAILVAADWAWGK